MYRRETVGEIAPRPARAKAYPEPEDLEKIFSQLTFPAEPAPPDRMPNIGRAARFGAACQTGGQGPNSRTRDQTRSTVLDDIFDQAGAEPDASGHAAPRARPAPPAKQKARPVVDTRTVALIVFALSLVCVCGFLVAFGFA
jgi:hypothetical protein